MTLSACKRQISRKLPFRVFNLMVSQPISFELRFWQQVIRLSHSSRRGGTKRGALTLERADFLHLRREILILRLPGRRTRAISDLEGSLALNFSESCAKSWSRARDKIFSWRFFFYFLICANHTSAFEGCTYIYYMKCARKEKLGEKGDGTTSI